MPHWLSFRHFRWDWAAATISPGEATHVLQRRVAETHAIPPLYIVKSGKIDIADVCTTDNPSSFIVLTCKTKTADFCLTITTLYDMLNEEVNLPQLDDLEGSKQTVYTHSED